MIKKMTRTQLINHLTGIKGATPATMIIETRPKLNKFARTRDENNEKVPNPFLDCVVKRTKMNVFLNVNYENSVNRQLGRESKTAAFESQQRSWGTHITPSLIVHNGQYYLQSKVEKRYSGSFIDTRTGEVIESNTLADYLPPRSKSKTQGTAKEIIVISTKIENITNINVKGDEIEVERF